MPSPEKESCDFDVVAFAITGEEGILRLRSRCLCYRRRKIRTGEGGRAKNPPNTTTTATGIGEGNQHRHRCWGRSQYRSSSLPSSSELSGEEQLENFRRKVIGRKPLYAFQLVFPNTISFIVKMNFCFFNIVI